MDNREQIVTAGLSLIDLHFHISGLHSDRFSTCARFMTFHDSEAARLCAVLQEGRCGLPKHAAICYGFDSRTRCATSIYFALPPTQSVESLATSLFSRHAARRLDFSPSPVILQSRYSRDPVVHCLVVLCEVSASQLRFQKAKRKHHFRDRSLKRIVAAIRAIKDQAVH